MLNRSTKSVCPLRAAVSPLFAGSLLVFSLSPGTVVASKADAQPLSASAKHGAMVFQKRCIACHNKQPGDDAPFGPPNLYTVFHRDPPLTTEEAETTIRDGKGNMPAFGNSLTATDIKSVITYLRTRPQTAEKPE